MSLLVGTISLIIPTTFDLQISSRIPARVPVLLRPSLERVERLAGRRHQPEGHAHGDEAAPGTWRCCPFKSEHGKQHVKGHGDIPTGRLYSLFRTLTRHLSLGSPWVRFPVLPKHFEEVMISQLCCLDEWTWLLYWAYGYD